MIQNCDTPIKHNFTYLLPKGNAVKTQIKYTMTNSCTCEIYDEETEQSSPASDCMGYCWHDQLYEVEDATRHLFDINDAADHAEWTIEGFPTWSGPVSGEFEANQPEELIRAITPNSTEWRLDYTVTDTELTGVLYHHDAPTGGRIRVIPKGGK